MSNDPTASLEDVTNPVANPDAADAIELTPPFIPDAPADSAESARPALLTPREQELAELNEAIADLTRRIEVIGDPHIEMKEINEVVDAKFREKAEAITKWEKHIAELIAQRQHYASTVFSPALARIEELSNQRRDLVTKREAVAAGPR